VQNQPAFAHSAEKFGRRQGRFEVKFCDRSVCGVYKALWQRQLCAAKTFFIFLKPGRISLDEGMGNLIESWLDNQINLRVLTSLP
jgi:hypothetical protein